MTRKEILAEAEKCVCNGRNIQYGEPEDNFLRIATLWNAYLGKICVTPYDVAVMMCLFKIARLQGSAFESVDSWIDMIGYAACGGEIATRGIEHEQ
jgi:gene 55 protein